MSQQLEQLFQICNLISRLKWKLGTSRYIIEHLMHAYSLSTRYIISQLSPTINDSRSSDWVADMAKWKISGHGFKIPISSDRTTFLNNGQFRQNAFCGIAVPEIHWRGYKDYI